MIAHPRWKNKKSRWKSCKFSMKSTPAPTPDPNTLQGQLQLQLPPLEELNQSPQKTYYCAPLTQANVRDDDLIPLLEKYGVVQYGTPYEEPLSVPGFADGVNLVDEHDAGGQLAGLLEEVNEAALRAVRLGRKAVNQEDLLVSFELVIAGTEKKGSVLTEFEKKPGGWPAARTDWAGPQ